MGTQKRSGRTREITIKEISVMAWIQDAHGQVLLVRQKAGRQLWSLPGGKVRSTESLKLALRRELREEVGLTLTHAHVIDLFDRPQRGSLAVLFQATFRQGPLKLGAAEILEAAFVSQLPRQATPTARHFWKRRFPTGSGRGQTLDL